MESRREKRAEIVSRRIIKARNVVGETEARTLCDPGSVLRLPGRDVRRARIGNGMEATEYSKLFVRCSIRVWCSWACCAVDLLGTSRDTSSKLRL